VGLIVGEGVPVAVGDGLRVGVATVGVLVGAVAVGDDVAGVGEIGVRV
jgi:hypothetical protein